MKNFRNLTNSEVALLTVDEIENVLDQMFTENENILRSWGISGSTEERIRDFIKDERYFYEERLSILRKIFSVGASAFIRNEGLCDLQIDQDAKLQRVENEYSCQCYYILTTSNRKYAIEEGNTLGMSEGWGVVEI